MRNISQAMLGLATVAAALVALIGIPAASAASHATPSAGPVVTDKDPAWG
ncbi:hypothetical protein [Streptomyces flavofungini]